MSFPDPIRPPSPNEEPQRTNAQHTPIAISKPITNVLSKETLEKLTQAMISLSISDDMIIEAPPKHANGKVKIGPSISQPPQSTNYRTTLTALTIKATSAIQSFQHSNISIASKSNVLAYAIKNESKSYYSDDHHFTFLTFFQVCHRLPPEYRNPVWDLLSQEFHNVSFKNLCPLTHALHTLSLFRQKSFDDLAKFLNIVSWIQCTPNQEEPSICNAVSFQKTIQMKGLKPVAFWDITLKTPSSLITLEFPANIGASFDTFDKDFPADLITPCLPAFEPLIPCKEFPCLSDKQLQTTSQLEKISKNLLLHSQRNTIRLGFHLLFTIAGLKPLSDFEEILLKALPLLHFTRDGNSEDRVIVSNIRVLFPTLLTEESFDRLSNMNAKGPLEPFQGTIPILTGWTIEFFPRFNFVKAYIRELLLQDESVKQKIGIGIWEVSLRNSMLNYTEKFSLLIGELCDLVTAKKANNSVVLSLLTAMYNLHTDKIISGNLLMSPFARFYLANDEKFQRTKSTDYVQLGAKLALAITNDCLDPINAQDVINLLLKRLLSKNEVPLACGILSNALRNKIVDAHSEVTHALAIQLYNSSSNKELFTREGFQTLLFEFPLQRAMLGKFRSYFFSHLKDLASIGHESQVSKLLSIQPHNLSEKELSEIAFLRLHKQKDPIQKLHILLKINKNALNKESEKIYNSISIELAESLVKMDKILLSLQLAVHALLNEQKYLLTFLKARIQEEIIPDTKEYGLILSAILSSSQVRSQEKIALLASCVDVLKPFSQELQKQVKEIHVNLHQSVNEDGVQAISLLQTLLKIFKPAELYKKNSEIWLGILKQLDSLEGIERSEILRLKKTIIVDLLTNKIIVATKHNFNDFRSIVHAQVDEYLRLEQKEDAIAFAACFEAQEIPHVYSELELSNLYRCLEIYEGKNDHENTLRLLKQAKKNECFSEDTSFTSHVTKRMNRLFQEKEYAKWAAICAGCNLQDANQEFQSACKTAIEALLNEPCDTNCLSDIFYLLETSLHPNALLWKRFFEAAKESSLHKLQVCNLIVKKNSLFPAVWTIEPEHITACLSHVLTFINDTEHFEGAHDFLSEKSAHLPNVLNQNNTTLTLGITLFEKLCKDKPKRDGLVKTLIPLLPKISCKEVELQWKLYKTFIAATSSSKDTLLMLASASMIHTIIHNEEHSKHVKEAVPHILEILKNWPKTNPSNKGELLPTGLLPEKVLEEISNAISSCSGGMYIEQYTNLIQNNAETLQLKALWLYRESLMHAIAQKLKATIHSRKAVTAEFKAKPLELAFQSEHPTTLQEALLLFINESFQEYVQKGTHIAICEMIIDKFMEIDSFKESSVYDNICKLLLLYTDKIVHSNKKPKIKYLDYFVTSNAKIIANSGNIESFTSNHYKMFCTLVDLAEKDRLVVNQDDDDDFMPHLVMLQTLCTAVFQSQIHKQALATVICKEFSTLFQSIQKPSEIASDDTFYQHMDFLRGIMYIDDKCLFSELYKHQPALTTSMAIEYIKSMKYLIDNLKSEADIIYHLINAIKTDFLNADFIQKERKLEYYENLFHVVEFCEEKDTKQPIYMLFLAKLLAIEPTCEAAKDKLIDTIYCVVFHYFKLCHLNRNNAMITKHLFPNIIKRLNVLCSDRSNFQNIKNEIEALLRKV